MNRTRRIAKRGGLFLLVSLLVVAGILSWNCWKLSSRQLTVKPLSILKLDGKILAERLQGAIRIATISTEMSRLTKDSELHRFGDYLESQYPTLHTTPWVRRTGRDFDDELNPSLLFEWPGQKPELGGILLMSHFDVVPVETNSLAEWTHSPFSGDIDDSFIWGRGTLDCKHGVMAIMEAVNLLVIEGFQPERTIYLAFGHDEELGGAEGNRKMAQWMRSHGRRLTMILDEGGCIFTEFPGLNRPAALVGVAEKGMLNVTLSVDVAVDQVGHASMPPPKTAVGILASAVHQVQNTPFPMRMDGGLRETLQYLGPEMPSVLSRMAVSNLWLCESLVKSKLGAKPSGNALLRTTIAPTLIEGGVQSNVLPQHAEATLNLRLLPGDNEEKALAHLRQAIGNPSVKVTPAPHGKEASPMSSTESVAFGQLHKTIREIYSDVVVAPFVLVGSTDTVHYTDVCDNIFRFLPARLSERDTQRFHGIDERLALHDYLDIVRFMHQLVRNTSQE